MACSIERSYQISDYLFCNATKEKDLDLEAHMEKCDSCRTEYEIAKEGIDYWEHRSIWRRALDWIFEKLGNYNIKRRIAWLEKRKRKQSKCKHVIKKHLSRLEELSTCECSKCDKNLGWWCDEAPNKVCEPDEFGYCKYCGINTSQNTFKRAERALHKSRNE